MNSWHPKTGEWIINRQTGEVGKVLDVCEDGYRCTFVENRSGIFRERYWEAPWNLQPYWGLRGSYGKH